MYQGYFLRQKDAKNQLEGEQGQTAFLQVLS
jgi:hypothetical protein